MDPQRDLEITILRLKSALEELPSLIAKLISEKIPSLIAKLISEEERRRELEFQAEKKRDRIRTDEYKELKDTAGVALMSVLQVAYSLLLSSH